MEPAKLIRPISTSLGSQSVLRQHDANELVFAVVGHVGSGTSEVAEKLKEILENTGLKDGAYEN